MTPRDKQVLGEFRVVVLGAPVKTVLDALIGAWVVDALFGNDVDGDKAVLEGLDERPPAEGLDGEVDLQSADLAKDLGALQETYHRRG